MEIAILSAMSDRVAETTHVLSGAKLRIVERLKRADTVTAPELATEFGLTDCPHICHCGGGGGQGDEHGELDTSRRRLSAPPNRASVKGAEAGLNVFAPTRSYCRWRFIACKAGVYKAIAARSMRV